MNKLSAITILSVLTSVTGCAHVKQFDQADAIISSAKTEVAAAQKSGNEWRDTDKLLGEAIKMRDNYRADEAVKLAQQALDQAKLAVAQAASQADASPWFNGQ
jgi:hypothetical protein